MEDQLRKRNSPGKSKINTNPVKFNNGYLTYSNNLSLCGHRAEFLTGEILRNFEFESCKTEDSPTEATFQEYQHRPYFYTQCMAK